MKEVRLSLTSQYTDSRGQPWVCPRPVQLQSLRSGALPPCLPGLAPRLHQGARPLWTPHCKGQALPSQPRLQQQPAGALCHASPAWGGLSGSGRPPEACLRPSPVWAGEGAGPGALTQLEPLSSSWIKTWKRSPCSCRTHQKRPPTLNRTTTKNSTTSSTLGTSLRAQVGGSGVPRTWGPGYQIIPAGHLPLYRWRNWGSGRGWGWPEATQAELERVASTVRCPHGVPPYREPGLLSLSPLGSDGTRTWHGQHSRGSDCS